MKLHRLTIHNLASIADAVIDFDAEPLAGSDVFLISGNTGSGKSTILDAICLALYGRTPRLSHFPNPNTSQNSNDTPFEEKVKDERQLMRRGTGEAKVTLTFTSTGGELYEAVWEVHRAHKKPSGSMQNDSRSLTVDFGSDKRTFSSKKEVEAEVDRAIGLNFEQFCRTTLLAQGEFTRFLISKDEEKSQILEKITGTEVYSVIGRRVYQETSLHRQEFEKADSDVASVTLFGEEQLAQLNKELEECEQQRKGQADTLAGLNTKLQWLKSDADLTTQLKTANIALTKAKDATETEEYTSDSKTIADWNATTEVRETVSRREQAAEERDHRQKELADLRKQYVHLKTALGIKKAALDKTTTDADSLEKQLSTESDRKTVYENEQAILELLRTYYSGTQKIKQEQDSINNIKKKLEGELKEKADDLGKKTAETTRAHDESETALKEAERKLTDSKLDERRADKDSWSERILKIKEAKMLADTFDTLKKEEQEARKQLAAIEKGRPETERMERELADAIKLRDTKEGIYNGLKESVGDWAKSIRAGLKEGDVCPVCGQTLAQHLPHEEELDSLFAKAKGEYEKAKEDAENKTRDLQNRKATIIAQSDSLQTTIKTLEKKLPTAENKLKEACAALNIADATEETFAAEMKKAEEQVKLCETSIAEGAKLQKDVDDRRKALETLRKTLEGYSKERGELERETAQCTAAIGASQHAIDSKGDEIKEATGKVGKLLGETTWDNDWRTMCAEFAGELREAAKNYRERIARLEELQREIKQESRLQEAVDDTLAEVAQKQPGWADIALDDSLIDTDAAERIQSTVLQRKATETDTKVGVTMEALLQAETNIKDYNKKIEEYLGQTDAVGKERLEQLCRMKADEVNRCADRIQNLREALKVAQGQLATVEDQMKKHQETKPQMEENENADTLEAKRLETEETMREVDQRLGAMRQQLEDNERNKRDLANKIARRDTLQAVYRKWDRLNNMVGDSTGKKFRNIAQSYVLANLIHSANAYMKTLAARYTLRVIPETFIITVDDSWGDGHSRPVSTLSGGETFLTSLALALALSDIGSHLSVNTLFIDEGFGTLSGEPLQNAVNTLRSLHNQTGRHVGIISHIEELRERIPVQIRVQQDGVNSASTLEITG